jgi:hypothetical protein
MKKPKIRPNEDLLALYGITTTIRYEINIFFETEDEDSLERQLSTDSLNIPANEADWTLAPGSPASSPYILVQGLTKKSVHQMASYLLQLLLRLGIRNIA